MQAKGPDKIILGLLCHSYYRIRPGKGFPDHDIPDEKIIQLPQYFLDRIVPWYIMVEVMLVCHKHIAKLLFPFCSVIRGRLPAFMRKHNIRAYLSQLSL